MHFKPDCSTKLCLCLLLCLAVVTAQESTTSESPTNTTAQICSDGELRLGGGDSPLEGRVEVCYSNRWGTVCDDEWGDRDAQVVCRQLGLSAQGARSSIKFDFGIGPIYFDNVDCKGDEEFLFNCSAQPIGEHDCNHFEDAGVICEAFNFSCADGDIRLLDGSTMYEGRVEVCVDNKFTTICSNDWDNAEAIVICNQLGFTGPGGPIATPAGSYDAGSGDIRLSGLGCNGTESNLTECSQTTSVLDVFCTHFDDVGVLCPRPDPLCTDGDIRLADGRTNGEGRVEVCLNSHWGTVCHSGWDNTDAGVVCGELGFPRNGSIAIGFGDFGRGEGLIFFSQVDCNGDEDNLYSCGRQEISQHSCTHGQDAGVICIDVNNTCTDGEMRLVDGETPNEGRLEVCYRNHWGTVCDDQFDTVEASLVCRELGFKDEGAVGLHGAYFGEGVGLIFIDDIECIGNETSLLNCSHLGIGTSNCFHNEDVSVLCQAANSSCVNGEVRLVNGSGEHSGRVEVCFNGRFGTVCDDSWGGDDATVVCKQLGYPGEGAIGLSGAYFGEGDGPIFLDNTDCSPSNHSTLLSCFDIENEAGVHNCDHTEDASVICPFGNRTCGDSLNGDVRLVGGSTEYEGRVELCLDGEWGTICDNFWSNLDAAVVCTQLTHGPTDSESFNGAYFGQGTGPIHLDRLFCSGDEERLTDCIHAPVLPRQCGHDQDVGVRCSVNSCSDGDIRLVDGTIPSEGRVEVCFTSQYRTVCDDEWDSRDAAVVCRQLGFNDGEGAVALPRAFFDQGNTRILLDDVRCIGNETSLLDCEHKRDPVFCFHFEDAGVICQSENASLNCTNGELRLVGGSSEHEGNVEVCFNGRWGNICHDRWGITDAQAVCRILGYDSEAPALPTSSAYFGQAVDNIIFLDEVQCIGNETNILDCPSVNPGDHDCSHFLDAGVICSVTNSSFECQSGELRLADGDSPNEGRVEVCMNGEWGTVCDDRWDESDAAVVCNQLGFGFEGALALGNAQFSSGTGPIFMTNLLCDGDEGSLFDCLLSGPGGFCRHSEDAGVICKPPPCFDGEIRLVGGKTDSEGTIEVCRDNDWAGTVCDDFWDNIDAAVACRQLGFSGEGAIATRGAFYGEGTGDILLDDVDCAGNETSLLDCDYNTDPFCFHFEDAGVICPTNETRNCTTGDVRIADGKNKYEGRVEVCIHGRWGTVCDDQWDANDAAVVCRQLGYTENGIAVAARLAEFGPGSGLIFLDEVKCEGTETTLLGCEAQEIGDHNCRSLEDASVFCPYPGSSCSNGDVQLVDGDAEDSGRVELCIGGVWNSICADRYWSNEDAQVICRQLGSENPDDAVSIVAGGGTGPIHIRQLECSGNESRITDCPIPDFAFISLACGDDNQDAGVICSPVPRNETPCDDGDIRLQDGAVPNEGRVEICFSNQWGSICDDLWDNREARVVCRQLGYTNRLSEALSIPQGFFGRGQTPIHLDELSCFGNETALIDCQHPGVGVHNCEHIEDAGVICIVNNATCESGDVRLVNGRTEFEGRLEVCLGGRWGTVCNDLWDNSDAIVVCRQLGYPVEDATATDTVLFGAGTELIFLDDLQCNGTETRILDCPSRSAGTHNCFHNEDVGVVCQFPTTTEAPVTCVTGDIRLVGGTQASEGTVEMCVDGEWGTVCSDRWDNKDASVACQKLGFQGEGAIGVIGSFFGAGSGDILATNVNCVGNETTITDCPYQTSVFCSHTEDAGVICPPGTPQNCTDGDVRLVGGKNQYEGRVEVCLHGRWGGVCDDLWDGRETSIVCRQLGYNETGFPVPVLGYPQFGFNTGLYYLDDLQCDGSESNLLRCRAEQPGVHDCSIAETAGVFCPTPIASACVNGDIQLVGGDTTDGGKVEVCVDGLWRTMCGGFLDFWTDANARTVCRQLGYTNLNDSVAIVVQALTEEVLFPHHYFCFGNETNLLNCPAISYIFPRCITDEYAGVICVIPETPCTDGDVRLADGATDNEGRVEICFNNQWGSVCDDAWDKKEAVVVCRQLGYGDVDNSVAFSNAFFGQGLTRIHLDEVSCVGNESSLKECNHSGVGNHNCLHHEDAGVLCIANSSVCNHGDLRLVGGNTELEGRVEVCIGGRWGTICNDMYDETDANVICNQLGFNDSGATPTDVAFFGQGAGPIFLDEISCTGNETRLIDCSHDSAGVHNCIHFEDIGVRCEQIVTQAPFCREGDIRLVGGSFDTEGTVELCSNEAWGSICDDLWDNRDATVVCRQLGFLTEGAVSVRGAFFGRLEGPIHLTDVSCSGTENNISDCDSANGVGRFCFHFEDSGVICPPSQPVNCTTGDVRIADGSTQYEGRVEVCIHGRWGTVCDDQWDANDAAVVCRQLGYTENGLPWGIHGANFGEGAGFIVLDEVRCEGDEEALLDCRASNIGEHNCRSSEDAGIFCPFVGSACVSGDVRLVNGMNEYEGRPEVCIGGKWGTICADFRWDDKDAQAICRQIGYSNPSKAVAYFGATYGEGTGPIFLGSLNCSGAEEYVLNCPLTGGGTLRFGCSHANDAGIQCGGSNSTMCDDGDVRLVGGVTENEGRVEICYENHWGTICDDRWDTNEATVVCRQLGYGDGEGAIPIGRAFFGQGVGRIYLDELSCERSDVELDACSHDGVKTHNCGHAEDAGVICIAPNPSCNHGDLQLVGGATKLEGRVEVCVGGRWGTNCDDLWGEEEAAVVCRQLEFSEEGAVAKDRAFFGQGSGPIFFDQTQCAGNETRLVDCTTSGTAVHNCLHSEDAGVICQAPPCTDNTVRLIGGIDDSNGIPQVCVNEVWGSVCGESFNPQAATAVCNGLGLTTSNAIPASGQIFEQTDSTTENTFDINVRCDANGCGSINATLNPQCGSTQVAFAGVVCPSKLTAGEQRVCDSGEVRLMGGSAPTEGRVEVCLNNVWGTVCDDSWDDSGAAVICRQLGYSSEGATAEVEGKYGPGTGPIYMDDVKCKGNEANIFSCPQLPLGTPHNCDHSEDATVVCPGKETTTTKEGPTGDALQSSSSTVAIVIPLVLIIILLIAIIIIVVIIFLVYRARKSGKLNFRSFDDERPIVHSDTFSSEAPEKSDTFPMEEKTDQL